MFLIYLFQSKGAYDTDELSSSNDETNADEDDDEMHDRDITPPSTSRNAFALLEDD